jgi:hypothetical protein
MTERWAPIPDHPNYEASSEGRVRSLVNPLKPRILKQQSKGRYLAINLRAASGGHKTRTVHQLVLSAFVGPLPKGQCTRHLDGDGSNNRSENLSYGTYAENFQDVISHGRYVHPSSARTHCPQGHPYDEENTARERGFRRCRECARAQSRAWRAGDPSRQREANRRWKAKRAERAA